MLGVSLADTSNREGVIGTFGSGSKHGVAVLLRNELNPVVFAGTLKLEFGTKPQTVGDGLAEKEFARVVVKYGGVDANGVNRSSTEDLGFVLDYGKQDWNESRRPCGSSSATPSTVPSRTWRLVWREDRNRR